jgi:hypothetical protein
MVLVPSDPVSWTRPVPAVGRVAIGGSEGVGVEEALAHSGGSGFQGVEGEDGVAAVGGAHLDGVVDRDP